MAIWQGKVETSFRVGAFVKLRGGYLVPRRATVTYTGDEVAGMKHPDLVAHFEIRDGVPECVAVHITASRGGFSVTDQDLAFLNLEAMGTRLFMECAARPHADGVWVYPLAETDASPEQIAGWQRSYGTPTSMLSASEVRAVEGDMRVRELLEGLGGAERRRRRGVPLAELRLAARIYLNDTTGAPVVAVQQRLGLSSYRTAARRIEKAREANLIPPDGASPEETAAARAALEEAGGSA